MGFLKFIIKLLIILAMIALPAIPLIIEYLRFRRDKKNKISFKRFRLLIFALLYMIALTVTLYLLQKLWQWFGSLSFVQWIAGKISVSDRFAYCTDVFGAILANLGIGALFLFLQSLVKIGLKKKDLINPKKKDGSFTLGQRIERAVIRFFHHETWYFVARILRWFTLFLTIAYGALFFVYEIPAVYGADWIPYALISMLFGASYIYPMITLITLWEAYYFLEGIRRVDEECPAVLNEPGETKSAEIDLEAIDAEGQAKFAAFFSRKAENVADNGEEIASADHSEEVDYIGKSVENDPRNPHVTKEIYLNCLEQLVGSEKSLLINGSFFSEFSAYFLRYLSIVAARGDNIILVCNSDAQIKRVHDFVEQGLSEISSIYCEGFQKSNLNFDHPIWKILMIDSKRDVAANTQIDECSILITSLNFLCSNDFEINSGRFVHLLDTVIFVDSLETVNAYSRQMSILNTILKQLAKKNTEVSRVQLSARSYWVSRPRQVRYICFDATRTPGMDRVLKNMLSVEIESADAMTYRPGVMVRCYNFEGRPDEDGKNPYLDVLGVNEEIGTVLKMAMLCLAKGAGKVTIFDNDSTPYRNFIESIDANSGQYASFANKETILINRYRTNPEEYSVIIAVDSHDNLPAAIREYASMTSDKPTLVIIFSRPYLLRDYYAQNIDQLWRRSQLQRIPVEELAKKDVIQKILIMANSGGITEDEIQELAKKVPKLENLTVNGILRAILDIYGIEQKKRNDLFDYFEYHTTKEFDEAGDFRVQNRIHLRRQGTLFDILSGRDMVILVKNEEEEITLPLQKGRLTQNFIAKQNLLYNGEVYQIHRIDLAEGKVHVYHALAGQNNEAYRYIQARHYRVQLGNEDGLISRKHMILDTQAEGVSVKHVYISEFRAPTEVLTSGYFEVSSDQMTVDYKKPRYLVIDDPNDDSRARQCYRKYGDFPESEQTYSFDDLSKNDGWSAKSKGALMLSVRLTGNFGEQPDKTAALAAAMLNEILHTMFPSVADAIAVCPVLRAGFDDEESERVMRFLPKISVLGQSSDQPDDGEDSFEILIIEDSDVELGVVSVLMSSGDDVLHTLFGPILDYLRWYAESDEKSEYLYYGLDHEPACFDFASLRTLSGLIGDDDRKLQLVDIGKMVETETCDFCGKRFAKGSDSVVELDDGRHMCRDCAANLVGNNKKILKEHLDRARHFLETTYGITLDDDYEFCFESTIKIAAALKNDPKLAGRGTDVPLQSYIRGNKVYVEDQIPSVSLSELLVRELTYIWQLHHIPSVEEKLAEGHIALVALQYLRFLNQKSLAAVRAKYYESTSSISGVGYRKLVHALLTNPQYRNNPFLYLLELSGDEEEIEDIEEIVKKPTPIIVEEGEYGRSYTPEKADRTTYDAITYFHYTRLTPALQKVYDVMLEGIRAHAERIPAGSGISNDDVRTVSYAILYDRPELFYFKIGALGGSEIYLYYGAPADEAASLAAKMEETIASYLEGIEDSMSAYDVAIRLHTRMIKAVDYDSIALNEEQARGGPDIDKIDYLRTICGVFLNGKVVCEGYARAMAYLLQRCGVECAECVGDILESGGGHAWNILKIDGDYYHLDVTWDDRSNTIQEVKNPHFAFDYFCITTDEMSRTRNFNGNPCEIPVCTATRANFHTHNELVLDKYDADAVVKIAVQAAESGRSLFTFKFTSKTEFEAARDRIFGDAADLYAALKQAAKKNKKIADDSWADWTYNKEIRTITITFKVK